MPSVPESPRPAARFLPAAFGFAVAAFAWLRFSENTADNDLWGHVLYGQRVLTLGRLEHTDVLSWTALGQPWINHEVFAEIFLGLVHRLAGGTGLWLAMLALAAVTVGIALRAGSGRERGQWLTATGLFAVSINFIALGYAVRPQLFTMLAFVTLLVLLRRFFLGQSAWGLAVPWLFAAWTNLHGGYFAGWIIVLLAVLTEGAACLWPAVIQRLRFAPPVPFRWWLLPAMAGTTTVALALNPWGFELVRWTFQTLLLPRPQITEWQPQGLTTGAVAFYLLFALSASAWLGSRLPRRPWEAATLAMLAVMAVLQLRHAPLFALANLMLTPPHLQDALRRLAPHCVGLIALLRRRLVSLGLTVALTATGAACLAASLAPPREHPFTIEVPRDTYPVAAIEFMRGHQLAGRTLTFFDWGQQVLWELPNNPVSFDGRLDTVYPAAIRDAHWRLYAGEAPGPGLTLAAAEVALLPASSGGVTLLLRAGWTQVYRDPLAAVLVQTPAKYSALAGLSLPVQAGRAAIQGRAPFPDALSLLATERRPR
jgi:hypothetical protein